MCSRLVFGSLGFFQGVILAARTRFIFSVSETKPAVFPLHTWLQLYPAVDVHLGTCRCVPEHATPSAGLPVAGMRQKEYGTTLPQGEPMNSRLPDRGGKFCVIGILPEYRVTLVLIWWLTRPGQFQCHSPQTTR